MKSKLKGLLAIMEAGLPCPDWRFAASEAELPLQPWADAPEGWTVRICPRDVYLFGLESRHYQSFDQLPSAMAIMRRKVVDPFEFVVYPSWRFLASGGCHVTADSCSLEAVRGSLKRLLSGEQSPDLYVRYEGTYFETQSDVQGDLEVLPKERIDFLRRSCLRLNVSGSTTVVLEWSWCKHDRRILFHDWVEA